MENTASAVREASMINLAAITVVGARSAQLSWKTDDEKAVRRRVAARSEGSRAVLEQAVRCWSEPTVEQFVSACSRVMVGKSEQLQQEFLGKLWGMLKHMGGRI